MRTIFILLLFPLLLNAQVYEYNGALITHNDSLVAIQEGGFSPLDYTPIAWYDSQDASTITKDGSNYVSQWNDKSSNGYNLTQGTGANQPLYSATNGIVFDGVNDFISKTSINLSNNITIFIVTKFNKNEVSPISSTSNLNTERFTFYSEGGALTVYRGTGYGIYNRTFPQSEKIYTLTYYEGIPNLWENNFNFGNIGSGISNIPTVGLKLGQVPNGAYSFDSYIKEIIIYNSALTTEQIGIVNAYLNNKYTIY